MDMVITMQFNVVNKKTTDEIKDVYFVEIRDFDENVVQKSFSKIFYM